MKPHLLRLIEWAKENRDAATVAAIGNPVAWFTGLSWGALASLATFAYFGIKTVFLVWDRYKGKKTKDSDD
jgi:hypothetical protein